MFVALTTKDDRELVVDSGPLLEGHYGFPGEIELESGRQYIDKFKSCA
jgi:hypothetical protein